MLHLFPYYVQLSISEKFPNQVFRMASFENNSLLLHCYEHNEAAVKKAKDLAFNQITRDLYQSLRSELCTLYNTCLSIKKKTSRLGSPLYDSKEGQASHDLSYLANLIGHRIYLILKTIDKLQRQHNLSDIINEACDKLQNSITHCLIARELPLLRGDCRTLIKPSTDIINLSDIIRFSDSIDLKETNSLKNKVVHNLQDTIISLTELHARLNKIAQHITDLCQSPEMQNYPELFKSICNIYKELECFLPKEMRIDVSHYLKDIKDENKTVILERKQFDEITDALKKTAILEITTENKDAVETSRSVLKSLELQGTAKTSLNIPESTHTLPLQKSSQEAEHGAVTSFSQIK